MNLKTYYLQQFLHDLGHCFRGAGWDAEHGQSHIPRSMIVSRVRADVLKHPAECMWCISLHRIINIAKCSLPVQCETPDTSSISDRMMFTELVDRLMPKSLFDLSSDGHSLACWMSSCLKAEGQCGRDLDRMIPESADLLREIHRSLIPSQNLADLLTTLQELVSAMNSQQLARGLRPVIRRLGRLGTELSSFPLESEGRA